MRLALPVAVAVTPPELTGVLVWWGIVLAVPVLLLRRWRRRHRTAVRRQRPRPAIRRHGAPPPALDRPGAAATPDRRVAHPARLADPTDEARPPAGALSSDGLRPPARSGRAQADGIPGARLSDATLEPLCRYVDFRRRLALALAELQHRLAPLPAERWRIEPYPLTGERGNTLLLLGETGVFVISATYAPGHWDDVLAASKLAGKIQLLLPGYPGLVQPAICHPFSCARPRLWHRPDERGDWVGAWVLGGDSVIDWLAHFGTGHGVSAADVRRFDELATLNWLKPAIPTPPSWPPVPEATQPGPQQ